MTGIVDEPQWRHFQPLMPGDEFLYSCGDVDVWRARFNNGPLGNDGRIDIVVRWGRDDYRVISTVDQLELEAAVNDKLLPLLARAKLLGKYP